MAEQLGFSTIIKKAPAATNTQTSDRLLKMSQVFQRNMNASSPNKVTINTGDNRMLNSEKLIYSDKQDTIPVVIGKKAKSSNKTLFRQGTLSRRDLFKFGQSAHNKSYATPLDFTGERRDEYMQASSAATKAEKKNILAWEAKEIAGLNFRIRFRRHKPDQQGPSDTAFYFEREDEWKKMMNYLKGIKLLETSQANFSQLLKSLSSRFKDNAVKKFREAIALRALFIKQTAVQKDVLIKQNLLLTQFNLKLLKDFTTQWRSIALIRDKSNKKLEQERLDRTAALELAANKSSLLATLNNRLMTIMGEAWHDKALEKATPTKEDINILFNTLELPASITSPSVRIEVKVLANLPDLLRLNGRLLQGKSREFRLSCVQRANNPKQNVRNWGIIAASGDISEEQKKFVKEAYAASTMNLSRANLEGDKFSLHFEDFPLEHLENVEIAVNVLDENRVMKAYHYTSLKGLQPASKKGKNAWLCMSTNEQNIQKLPLLHLKLFAQVARTIQERRQLAGRAVNPAKTADNNLIEDTFYNYSFRVPNVTPERVPLLELLPGPWNIMDPRTRELQGSVQERAKFIQRVKYKLSKHYHETTSRQIARLKKSAYIWAELQDDVMTYFPGRNAEERSELYANEGYINQVTQGGEYEGRTAAGNVVSYLFKRDLWESKAEWRRFYVELERLCKKGILPQNRLDIWSEMSRVIYFVKLTEDHGLTDLQKQGSGLNRSAGLNPEDDVVIRSRKVYNILKEDSQKNCSIFYQNLEDDIRDLRKSFGVSKLPYEHNIRHICRAFIYWSKIFSDPAKDPKSQYFITYSRTVATLCHGFLVCQTCSFVEGNTGVEEHQIFWLLISLVTYILSSYFETNEKSAQVDTLTLKKDDLSRRRNTLTNSALRCNQVKGIKSDLLLLKVLLKDYQPEIHEKFEELGLPLEYYFGDYMLSLFFNLFNPGLTFRIWDVLFFEGSSANQVKCNRMIVCVIYTLLQECKQQILQAREGADIKFIIEMYAKFQTSYGDFLRKCYEFCNGKLEQTVPNSETVMGKLNLIRYAFFSDEYNKLDNQTQKFEKIIEDYYRQTIAQNVELYKFARQEYQYRPGGDHEIMSYPILAGLIQSFIASYGNPNAVNQQNIQASEAARKLLKEAPVGVWVKVYSTTSPIEDVRKTALNVSYGFQQLTKRDYNPLSVDLEGMFTTRELAGGAGRELKVEILDERDPSRPKRIKYATIDLKTIPVNVVTKLNLRLNEEDPNIYSENFVASEIELAILVETAPEQEAHLKAARKEFETILLRDLEDVHYKDFRIQNIKNSFASEIKAHEGLDDNALNTFSVLRRSPAAWKENFVMSADEFADAMRNLAPFWTESEIRNVHKSITRASKNSVFYITDFFILLILYVKGTLNQKYGLLFDLLTGFDLTSATPEISLHNLRGLASELYDLFMIHIPSNQIDNMIDLAATGHASCIKQVIINEQIESAKVEYPRQVLNKISNFVHLNAFSKDVPVQTAEIIKLLRNIYEKEILPTAEGRRSLQSQNTIDIIYFTDGRNHRLTLYVDQDWKPQEHQSHQHEQAVLSLLDCYRNVLPLTTPSTLYNREQFVQILQKLPLINYLSSFENSDSTQTYMLLNEIKFSVLMESDPLLTVKPSYDPVPPKGSLTNLAGRKREKFEKILRNWAGIARQAGSRTRPSSPSRVNKQDLVSIPAGKLDAFLPLSKIIENIKRTVMRNAAETYNNSGSLDAFQSSVYNEHFYTLDYDITIIMNKSKRFTNIDPNYTPFLAIMDFVETGSVVNRSQNLEIVFSLKSSRIPDTYREHYNQLAVYRHSDGSSEWLPCKIDFKFQFGQADANIDSSIIDGFGVIFERFPGEVFIKKGAEVIVSQQVDMDELLLKRIDKTTWRAVTVDQIARNLDKSTTFKTQNRPQQQSQQGYSQNQNQFDDPLNRNAQSNQKSIW